MQHIDIHAHVNFQAFDEDREEVMARAKDSETGMINVGSKLDNSQLAVKMAEKHENCWAIVGQHPVHADKEFDEDGIRELLSNKMVVGVGETGLDYFHNPDTEKEQKELFHKNIKLAKEFNKPIMLHTRPSKGSMDAYEDTLEIIREYKGKEGAPHFHVHFYIGNLELAKEFLALNCTFSFNGVITFTHDYDKVVKEVPIDQIMSETDCPYVSPDPYRGKRNEPTYVIEVIKKIAEIKGIALEAASNQMLKNARRVFGLEHQS